MVGIRDVFKGVVMGCMASSALGYRPGDQTCSYASGSTCPVASLALSSVDGSALVYPGGTTRCAFDDFQDASYSTNATFFFQVFPKKESKKLLIFLQGGGACVDKYTCNFAVQCALGASSTFTTTARASSSGVFNRSDPGNLFNAWNIVHVPYCTGDLHVGARVLPAAETGLEAAFNRPQCLKQDKAMHMNGFENTKAAVQWARANFPDVSELVLGGASAGSLGAQALAAYVADAWSVPQQQQQQGASGRPRYAILADSYVGVLPDGATGSQVLNYYGACDADLKVPPAVAQGCKAETLQVAGLVSAMLQLLPQSDWLFLNSQGDRTQRYFYQLVKDGVFGFPFPNLLSEADFYARMTKILGVYTALSSRVSTFFVPGDRHVFLQGGAGAFYDTVTTGGQRLGAVLAQWLAQSGEPTTTAPPPAPPSPSPSVSPSPSPSSPSPATAC